MWIWWLGVFATVAGCEGARILAIFPFPSRSHQRVVAPLLRELAVRGHYIKAYMAVPMENPPSNMEEIMLPNILPEMKNMIAKPQEKKESKFLLLHMMDHLSIQLAHGLLQLDVIKELIHSEESFDLIFSSSTILQEPLAAFQHKFGAPAIDIVTIGSFDWVNSLVGNPENPTYYVSWRSDFTDRMNFLERLENTFFYTVTLLHGYMFRLPKLQAIVNRYFNYTGWETRPPLLELLSNKSMVFQNVHLPLGFPLPTAPHVVSIGGINIHPPNPLPKDIQDFMDEAADGVIYFSLGSNIDISVILKDELFETFVSVLGKLKQRVLWKWEKNTFPNQPKNIKISKWFPQQDILGHKNCKLFITHAGLLSLTESVYYGVPIIGIPMFGDQPRNIKDAVRSGYGLELRYSNLTQATLHNAIQEILTNSSYKETMTKASKLFRDRPANAIDTAVFWTEYVIRHKGALHLRPALAEMPWYSANLVDVLGFFLVVIISILFLLYRILSKCFRVIFCKKNTAPLPKKTQ